MLFKSHSEVVPSDSWEQCMGFFRRLAIPATESHLTVALVLCMLIMALLLCGIVWQSGIITYQRDLIHELWQGRFGG
jgi:hypothetical protein